MTGVGFHCDLEIPTDVPSLPGHPSFALSDLEATIEGLARGAGLVLFISDGRLTLLECFTYDEPWPDTISSFTLFYRSQPRDLPFRGR